jgi:hypothetical protein
MTSTFIVEFVELLDELAATPEVGSEATSD